MANNRIQWEGWTDRGTVLGTELNSLSNGNRSNAGTEVDNSTNKDELAKAELSVTFGSNPSAGGYVGIFLVEAPDGTNYADGSSSVDPGAHTLVAAIPVRATTNAQRLVSRAFRIPPFKFKLIVLNASGQAFPASGSTLDLYTGCREIE